MYTIFSTLGGLLGYYLGFAFIEFAVRVVEFYGYENKVIDLKVNLSQGSGLYVWLGTLFLAGHTPLPFKVFTITSGIINFNIFIFFIICLISRGLRFFIVAFLTAKFGGAFETFMQKKELNGFTILGLFITFLAIIIYLIIK